MADLVGVIDKNECLREYFKEFPKQLMKLMSEVMHCISDSR